MLTQWIEMIESVTSSQNAALIISLGAAIAFACGLWRRETINNSRYDTLRADCSKREDSLLASINQKEDELAKLSREVFEVLKDTVSALTGMEETLDGLEALVRMVIKKKLEDKNA
ncbi:MAG: hypothetical protein ABIC40_08980 [bacterium]